VDGGFVPIGISSTTSFTFTRLPKGSTTLYACAVDTNGARSCETAVAVVGDPGPSFDAVAAVQNFDLGAVLRLKDPVALAGAALFLSAAADLIPAGASSPPSTPGGYGGRALERSGLDMDVTSRQLAGHMSPSKRSLMKRIYVGELAGVERGVVACLPGVLRHVVHRDVVHCTCGAS